MNSFVVALVTVATLIGGSAGEHGMSEAEIQRLLKQRNKPAVKSIPSPDGRIIDCVHIMDQPGLDHPLLRNHTIQMRPTSYPKGFSEEDWGMDEPPGAKTQLWRKNGECPKNTVPITRTTREDLLREARFPMKKQLPPLNTSLAYNRGHEYATIRLDRGRFHGASAYINLWDPEVETYIETEFSLAQIWVASGNVYPINVVEAGWQVCPFVYDDLEPHFFIYWTRDSYKNTGCYNFRCAGFIQTDHRLNIGGPMRPVSDYNGIQHEFKLAIWKNITTGDWWLGFGGLTVGYWPSAIVPGLENYATSLVWGGEIVNNNTKRHTCTQMGSGRFPEEGFGKAAYFSNVKARDLRNQDHDPVGYRISVTRRDCYDLISGQNRGGWGTYFFYGGPGFNDQRSCFYNSIDVI